MNGVDRLQNILTNSTVGAVLSPISQLNLPNWWLAGGAVRNTVWRSIFGENCKLFIKDFDIAFFDENGERNQELTAKAALNTVFPDYLFDIKNQASFGRWRSGRKIYTSTEDGIKNWLHTTAAIGVRLNTQGEWEFFTPYGLDDLFNGIIRPTPANIDNPDAQLKADGYLQKCPCLRLV
ncbi:nucleotidyltransferase family protein [Plectonema cf. radiosum LEGE 06105]|uniref:Nucleotidyltransferase family protein n=1 Tax=Plectonema cf. radiosum LEGE 06105 TaxID=945769 RepID=A0A8J7F455_9CYAN|nr:nucleotidyltransferase family protein [Plectonema radiosum]MBE9212064.1 nucleotidyltransferase family protein [Plectonema cf. radiosum LEGE 06105]